MITKEKAEKPQGEPTHQPPKKAQPAFKIKPKKVGVRDLNRINDEELLRRMTGEAAVSADEARRLINPSARDVAEKEARPESKVVGVKNYPKPQDELDLHGKKAVEAERDIWQFVTRAARLAMRTIRIITGKGLHSEEGQSVLKSVAESKLQELKREGKIFKFEWEKGGGSVVVYLA